MKPQPSIDESYRGNLQTKYSHAQIRTKRLIYYSDSPPPSKSETDATFVRATKKITNLDSLLSEVHPDNPEFDLQSKIIESAKELESHFSNSPPFTFSPLSEEIISKWRNITELQNQQSISTKKIPITLMACPFTKLWKIIAIHMGRVNNKILNQNFQIESKHVDFSVAQQNLQNNSSAESWESLPPETHALVHNSLLSRNKDDNSVINSIPLSKCSPIQVNENSSLAPKNVTTSPISSDQSSSYSPLIQKPLPIIPPHFRLRYSPPPSNSSATPLRYRYRKNKSLVKRTPYTRKPNKSETIGSQLLKFANKMANFSYQVVNNFAYN